MRKGSAIRPTPNELRVLAAVAAAVMPPNAETLAQILGVARNTAVEHALRAIAKGFLLKEKRGDHVFYGPVTARGMWELQAASLRT